MLPTIRLGARGARRHRSGATSLAGRCVDRTLGVSRARRRAGYVALASGLYLLRPALRRLVVLVAGAVALTLALRFVV